MAELKMCANKEMAIYILEFIKRGYEKNYQDGGVQKYIEALQMGIDALEKQIPKKPTKKNPIIYRKTKYGEEFYAYDYHCPMCDVKLKVGEHHCVCGQNLDWSDKYMRVEDVNNTIDDLIKEIHRLEEENKDLKDQFCYLDIECERLEKETSEQEVEIERLQSMNQAKLDTIHDLMEENEKLKQIVEEFEDREMFEEANDY